MMATIVTFGLILISFLVSLWVAWPDVNFISLATVPLIIAVTLPVLFNASFRTLWTGIDLMMNALEPGEATRNFDPVTGIDVVAVIDTEEGATQQR